MKEEKMNEGKKKMFVILPLIILQLEIREKKMLSEMREREREREREKRILKEVEIKKR